MMKEIDAATFKPKGILVAMVGLCIVIAIGAVFYANAESLKWIDAVYFTVVTATTVGFGDYYPETLSGERTPAGQKALKRQAVHSAALDRTSVWQSAPQDWGVDTSFVYPGSGRDSVR
jgi:hypothetical protein